MVSLTRLNHWALGCSILGAPLLVGGCAGGSTAPTFRDTMIVIGGGSGPVYTKLRSQFREARGSGQETSFGRAKLVVVNGAALDPASMASLPLLRKALDGGVSVLFLNASEPHKKALLQAKLTALCPRGSSDAFLLTPLGGGSRFHVTNLTSRALGRRSIAHERNPNGVLIGQHRTSTIDLGVTDEVADGFLTQVEKRLAEQSRGPATTPTPPSDYPADQWAQYAYTETWNTGASSAINNQSIGHDITYTFTMYFDSGDSLPSHWFQWVAVSVDGTVNPSAPTQNDEDHRGWVATQTVLSLNPVNSSTGNGLELAFVESQPSSASNSLQSALSFNIGYKGSGGNTAWLWSQSLSQTTGSFSGWQATSAPPTSNQVNAVAMNFMQTSPFNGDGSNWTDAFYTVFQGKHLHSINSSSANTMEILGQALWRTQQVFPGVVAIELDSMTKMTSLEAKNEFFYTHEYYSAEDYSASAIIDLDLSAIVPAGVN